MTCLQRYCSDFVAICSYFTSHCRC